MHLTPIPIALLHQGVSMNLYVLPCTHPELYCSYKVTDRSDYLFTLVPTNDPFTDFELSAFDRYIDHPVDENIFEKVKEAVINYYL
jgi:hypothetical protein